MVKSLFYFHGDWVAALHANAVTASSPSSCHVIVPSTPSPKLQQDALNCPLIHSHTGCLKAWSAVAQGLPLLRPSVLSSGTFSRS